MEKRIQREIEELEKKYSILNPEYFKRPLKPRPTYEELREEAVRIVEKEIAQEEDFKKRIQQQKEERERIEKETREKQLHEKKEEEERERYRKYKELEEERNVILENRITSNRLLVIADIEEIECDEEYGVMANFESELLKKALDELNIEIIKRIVRKTYPHKFE